jgi:hypothetical protein
LALQQLLKTAAQLQVIQTRRRVTVSSADENVDFVERILDFAILLFFW